MENSAKCLWWVIFFKEFLWHYVFSLQLKDSMNSLSIWNCWKFCFHFLLIRILELRQVFRAATRISCVDDKIKKKNSLKENFCMLYMLHLLELGDTVSQVTDECSSNLYLRIITSGPQMAIIWWSMSLMNVHNNVTVCHLMLGRLVVQ